MQTFVTYHSHVKTFRDLDTARLGKQRVEAKQILMALRGETSSSWNNHPAVQMWAGYEPALVWYGLLCCHEWRIVRGFNDKLWGDFALYAKGCGMLVTDDAAHAINECPVEQPPWLADKWVLRSHRSRLVQKAEHIYADKYPGTPEDMPYLWPVVDHMTGKYELHLSKADFSRIQTGERWLPEGFGLDNLTVYPPKES